MFARDNPPLSRVKKSVFRERKLTELMPADAPLSTGLAVADQEAVGHYITASTSAATLRAYRADWASFEAWCSARGLTALPASPETVAAHLAALADDGASPATVSRRASGIGWAHERNGHDKPTQHPGVRATLRGVRRQAAQAGRSPRKARALSTTEVRALVEDLPPGLAGIRDRAIVLAGFALGLRASDIAWLDVADLEIASARPDGLDVRIRHSKTDQAGAGVTLALAPGARESTCPVRALRTWLSASGLETGPLFRAVGKGGPARLGEGRIATSTVTRVLARAARRAGVDPAHLSAHSLRRGFATVAYQHAVPEREIARTGRWASVTVMRSYDASSRWQSGPASGRLGL